MKLREYVKPLCINMEMVHLWLNTVQCCDVSRSASSRTNNPVGFKHVLAMKEKAMGPVSLPSSVCVCVCACERVCAGGLVT